MRAWMIIAALVGCGQSEDSGTDVPVTGDGVTSNSGTTTGAGGTTPVAGATTTTQTGGWACRTDIPAEDLHGGYPNEELALVDFTAFNYDGTERHKEDLQGHITVVWFYPLASSGG